MLDALNSQVAASDVAIFASPTYKASYTGLLKAFLDRYGAGALSHTAAIPIYTGASLAHHLAPTATLVPLLLELGATVPGPGLYFVIEKMDRLDSAVAEMAQRYRANILTTTKLAKHLSD